MRLFLPSLRRLALVLVVPPALVGALLLARLLPAEGVGLGLRLALATACVLLPGALVAGALGLGGVAATLALGFGTLFLALLAVFALETSLTLAVVVLAGIGVAALPFAARRAAASMAPGWLPVLGLGAVFGVALWQLAPQVDGDALFHLARVRKLDAFGSLSLDAVNEFADGGLHPGYAFPLWHGFLALVASLAGVEPELVVMHEPTVLAPLAFLVAYEAGYALFRSRAGAAAVLLAQVALIGLAPAGGGAYISLALPATGARQLIVPAALALAFSYYRDRRLAWLPALGAAGLALALVHPTYAVFLCLPLLGYLVARAVMARTELLAGSAALAAVALPTAAVAVWLLPTVRSTASHTPGLSELERAFQKYPGQLDVFSEDSYRLAPELFARSGAVAVAALVLVPLAALAPLRRWAAFVLGGSLVVLAVTLTAFLFPHFADVVSISQARRAAGFLPLPFAFAGGALLVAQVLRLAALPIALAGGIVLQLAFPGDFGYLLEDGGPPVVTWIAALGGAAALAVAALARWPGVVERRERIAGLAAALFVLPVAVHGIWNWTPRPESDAHRLTPGLVEALRRDVPEGAVVFSDAETSYRIAAFAPVYVAAAPPAHVADTEENRPYERKQDVNVFLLTGDLAIPRGYGAHFLVIDLARFDPPAGARGLYRDGRFLLARIEGPVRKVARDA
jgi:hypothetical protein